MGPEVESSYCLHRLFTNHEIRWTQEHSRFPYRTWYANQGRLFLDARVVDLTRLYRPIFGTISPWRPFCFNGPDNEGRCVGHVEAEAPGIQ